MDHEVVGNVFFFSSRRRHTRCGRDWSSDVCSSDLTYRSVISDGTNYWASGANGVNYITAAGVVTSLNSGNVREIEIYNGSLYVSSGSTKIGRASCRERGETGVRRGTVHGERTVTTM